MAIQEGLDTSGGAYGAPRRYPWDPAAVNALYERYLGRSAGVGDYEAHRANPGGLAGIERAILGSPEYAQHKATTVSSSAASPSLASLAGVTSVGTPTTGWGFTSRTGGRGTLAYTPATFGGDYQNLEGFDWGKLENPEEQSVKYIFARATQGLAPGQGSLDTVVERLKAMGFTSAKKVGTDQIDLGLGEGPMDVIRGGTDALGYHAWQWIPGGDSGSATTTASATTVPTTPLSDLVNTVPPNERVANGVLPASTSATSPGFQTPVSDAFIADTVVPYYQAAGIEVLEVQGHRMRVLTPADQQAGNLYGTWVNVYLPTTSMAGLGEPAGARD